MRLLFLLSGGPVTSAVQGVIRALLARGHQIVVALQNPGRDPAERLLPEHPDLEVTRLPERSDVWRIPATAIRRRLDHLRSIEHPGVARSPFEDRPPLFFRVLLALPPCRWDWGRRMLTWLLRRLEAGMPIPRSVRRVIVDSAPDRVLVSPLVEFGSTQVDYVRAAHAAGVASVFVVGAPDDLGEMGSVHEDPTLTIAADESSAAAVEAIERLTAADLEVSRRGRLLRPVLWLLTPLLVIALPVLRPRATANALVKRVRAARRARRKRAREKAKLKLAQAKKKERAKAIEAKLAAKAEADAAKRAKKARAEEAKREAKANGKAAKPGEEAEGPKSEPAKRRAAPKRSSPGLRRRGQRLSGRMRKRATGGLKVARRRWKYTRRGVRRVYNRRYRFTYGRKITRVPSRDELPALLNARGLLGSGVEIGVKTGLYSNQLLTSWHGDKLISVDPWLSADPHEYVDRSNVAQDEFERYYQETRERLSVHGARSTIWRMTSIEAAPRIDDQSLDFVYIDARHDYDSVLEDLEAWCGKVKPGGILAGHDYVDGDLPQGEFYVKSAVDKFFGEREIPVHGTEGPSVVEMFPTWIVEVPDSGIEPTRPGEPSSDQANDDQDESQSDPTRVRASAADK